MTEQTNNDQPAPTAADIFDAFVEKQTDHIIANDIRLRQMILGGMNKDVLRHSFAQEMMPKLMIALLEIIFTMDRSDYGSNALNPLLHNHHHIHHQYNHRKVVFWLLK